MGDVPELAGAAGDKPYAAAVVRDTHGGAADPVKGPALRLRARVCDDVGKQSRIQAPPAPSLTASS